MEAFSSQPKIENSLHIQQLLTLHEISRTVNSTLDLPEVLNSVIKLSVEIFQADAGSLMLINRDGELAIEAAIGLPEEIIKKTRVKIGDGIAGWVAKTGETLLLDGKVRDQKFKGLVDRKEDISSSLCVPLKIKERIIGVLMIRRNSPAHFTGEQLNFLKIVADQVAIAIENARLYTETKKVDRMKSEFVSMVSHELKTPLTAIIGFVELLILKDFSQERVKNYLKIVKDESYRLLRLITNLLDLSKLEAGLLILNKEVVKLDELVLPVAEFFQEQTEKHVIKVDFAGNIPVVEIDRDLIIQVFENLIENAIKYSPGGGEIGIAIINEGDKAEIRISDRGMGIEPAHLDKIFYKFYRVDSSLTRETGGTGLGLANVKYIIEAHGGSIRAESTIGAGSTFIFTLPLVERGD